MSERSHGRALAAAEAMQAAELLFATALGARWLRRAARSTKHAQA